MSALLLLDPEVARPLLAGWITGAAVGLADTALVLVAIARSPAWPRQLAGLRVRLPIFAIVAVNAMLIGWTLVGLLLGALWIVVPAPRFAIGVCVVFLGVVGLYAFVRGLGQRGEAMVVLGTGLLAAAAFAGILPALAAWR